jgi:hypothetical protein
MLESLRGCPLGYNRCRSGLRPCSALLSSNDEQNTDREISMALISCRERRDSASTSSGGAKQGDFPITTRSRSLLSTTRYPSPKPLSFVQPPMKTLIIRNYATGDSWGQQTIDSFLQNIRCGDTPNEVEICGAVEGQPIPDLNHYNLVILTGGTYNLLALEISSWVEHLVGIIRSLASGNSETKLLGLCWGHQAIHFALGGTLGFVPEGPRVSI